MTRQSPPRQALNGLNINGLQTGDDACRWKRLQGHTGHVQIRNPARRAEPSRIKTAALTTVYRCCGLPVSCRNCRADQMDRARVSEDTCRLKELIEDATILCDFRVLILITSFAPWNGLLRPS